MLSPVRLTRSPRSLSLAPRPSDRVSGRVVFGILTITGLSPLDVGQELPNPSSETFPSPEIYEGGKTCSGGITIDLILRNNIDRPFLDLKSKERLGIGEAMGDDCYERVGPVPLVIGPGIGISTGWGRVVVGSASAERDALYLPDQGKKAYWRTGRSRTRYRLPSAPSQGRCLPRKRYTWQLAETPNESPAPVDSRFIVQPTCST
ncbi:hypothetical protein Q3G72_008190 [Acer saccharum]|nr:hypothetical protein Q3G72_008190 [Acer saccharum]